MPVTAQNLPASTQQRQTTGTVVPQSNGNLNAANTIADSDSAQSDSGSRKKRKLTPPPPVTEPSFTALNGCIVPSGKRTTLRAECDRFTDLERLALYTRFRDLAT
jgi:hypothetical protein